MAYSLLRYMVLKMRVKYFLGIVSIIAALIFLIYTVGGIQEEEQEKHVIEMLQTYTDPVIIVAEDEKPVEVESQTPTSEIVEIPESYPEAVFQIDDDEAVMLQTLAMSEATGEGVEGKALVMLVVLNRVQDPHFPNDIEGVIFEENQFSPVCDDGSYWTAIPDDECLEALELIQSGWDESQGALYFESRENDSWQSRVCEFLFQYGNHKFYK